MIAVTRAAVPSFKDFCSLLSEVFATRQFTNHGPMVRRLEQALQEYLAPPAQSAVTVYANGTLALELALRAAGGGGKRVITTPFTYVATLSAILSAGYTPVFVDIDPHTLCLTPQAAAPYIDEHTAAILPVHIYGNACDIEGFISLSKRYGVPVVYDAAHAFGACYAGQSLLAFGSSAIGSFHATKIFHTCEGGCVVSHSEEARNKLALMRSFGHVGDTHTMPGGNSKMSELHAAMGLCLLPQVQANITARKHLTHMYDTLIAPLPLQQPLWREGLQRNHAYYPVIFENEKALLAAQSALVAQDIVPRRYFYPALTSLPYLRDEWKQPCPVAESVSKRVLCLPLYAELTEADIERIVRILGKTLL